MTKAAQTHFGQRFKAIREEHGLSVRDFAAAIGVDGEHAVALFEANAVLPPTELLLRLESLYKGDLHELLTGTPPPGIEVEVEQLRKLKHAFRLVYNDMGSQVQNISAVQKQIKTVEGILQEAISPYKIRKDRYGKAKEKQESGPRAEAVRSSSPGRGGEQRGENTSRPSESQAAPAAVRADDA